MFVALENVRSLYNVGSVMRTMSFFGIKKLLLVGYSGRKKPGLSEIHIKTTKTALGAEKDLDIRWMQNSRELIRFTRENKLRLIAIEQDKKSVGIQDWQPRKNSIVVLGNEVDGVSREVLRAADKVVEIPRLGKKGSLNVATTAGIIINKLVGKSVEL